MSAADHASHDVSNASAGSAWDQAVAFYEASKEPNSRAGDLLATGFIVLTGLYSLAVIVTAGLRLGNIL